MPNTKNSEIRYRILDRYLRRGGYSTDDLHCEINRELEMLGFPKVCKNTIRGDMDFIGSQPGIEIESVRKGKFVTYGYANRELSMYRLQLNEDEIGQMMQCVAMLSRFEGMPHMEWISSFVDRFKLSLDINTDVERVVGLDENKYLHGLHYFGRLLSAITNREVLRLTYTPFHNSTPGLFSVHPYYLKEYNNRWFLIARTEGREDLSNYAFDRIDSIDSCPDIKYIPNDSIDFNDDYFNDMVGVSRLPGTTVQQVTLWVSPEQTPYVKTKPLHETQKLRVQEDGSSIVSIEVYPNYELEQLLLSFCEGVRVMAPADLVSRIKERLNEARRLYES